MSHSLLSHAAAATRARRTKPALPSPAGGTTRPPRPAAALAFAALALSALSADALAQTPEHRFLVSTSTAATPIQGPLGTFDVASLVVVAEDRDPLPWHLDGHWLALTKLVPGHIDAVAIAPGFGPLEHRGLCFSMLADAQGFKDGDVLLFGGDGTIGVYISEAQIAVALGVAGNGLDLDGMAFDGQGRLLFSLQNDVTTAALGQVLDGDVLRLDFTGGVTRILTEADVQAAYTAATGSTAAIGDVQGIEWWNGEIWVAVQAPSSADGGVLRVTGVPAFVVQETRLGLGGAEINALARLPGEEPFVLWLDNHGGGNWMGHVAGGTPGGLIAVFACGTSGFYPYVAPAGFGAWYFDLFDPLLAGMLTGGGPALIALDGLGRAAHPFKPSVASGGIGFAGELGVTVQAIDLGTLRVSQPFRVVH